MVLGLLADKDYPAMLAALFQKPTLPDSDSLLCYPG
jgi:hypothetical protein